MIIVTLTDQRWGNIWQTKQSSSMVSLKGTVRFENHRSLSLCTLLRPFHTALAYIYAQARALLRCQNSINESQTPNHLQQTTTGALLAPSAVQKQRCFYFLANFTHLFLWCFALSLAINRNLGIYNRHL